MSMFGEWRTSPDSYIDEVRRCVLEIGNLSFAAQQDWMCEPFIISKTGLSVKEHQLRTTINYMYLMERAPTLPWMPVIQGFKESEYLEHVDLFYSYGIDLRKLDRVGIGSVCRRQGTLEVTRIIGSVARLGIPLHGFGLKTKGLANLSEKIKSCDTMSWSVQARKNNIQMRGCGHRTCSSCMKYALKWRKNLLKDLYFEDED